MTAHERIYLLLAGIFVSALIATNVIAAKFFEVHLFGLKLHYSVSIFAYPVTFLATDIISEVYGKKRANYVVVVGFVVSVFILCVIFLGGRAPIWSDSPLSQANYDAVFGYAPRILLASMAAYLVAQFVDIRLFHFWKRLTRGRHLWLRNNASTLFSQLVDTALVVVLTTAFTRSQESGEFVTSGQIAGLILSGYTIKAAVALLDTPIIYLVVHAIRRWAPRDPFGVEMNRGD